METINKHYFSDMGIMLGRSMRHILRSMDTIITVTITPIAMLLLFVYVLGGAIQSGTDNYVNYLLPGILLMAIASGIAYTSYRLFMDMQRGIFERFHSMPIARSAPLWGHVLTSLVSNAISVIVIILVALLMGFRSSAGVLSWLAVAGILALFTLALTWIAVIAGLSATSVDGAGAFAYPTDLPAVYQLGVCAHSDPCQDLSAPLPKTSQSPSSSMRYVLCSRGSLSVMIYGLRLRGVSGLCSWLISLR